MKRPFTSTLLTLALLLSMHQVGTAQNSLEQSNVENMDVSIPRRIKPGEAYSQSFPIKAHQKQALNIRVRNGISFGRFLKKSLPFVAATTYGLIKQQQTRSSSFEGGQRSSVAPYLAGGALASGASIALSPRHNRVQVELTYRNMNNSLLRTRKYLADTRKINSINVGSWADGWVDVVITAPQGQGLRVQSMDLGEPKTNPLLPAPGIGPSTNTECEDPDGDCDPSEIDEGDKFGIESGSGSMGNPYVLSAVNVIAQGTGQSTTVDVGFYSYSGGYYGNTYYGEGSYSTDAYDNWTSSGNYETGTTINNTTDNQKDIEKVDDKCSGYKRMLTLQKNNNQETAAFVTTNGEIFILPMEGNTEITSSTSNEYRDNQNRVVATIYEENGQWKMQVNDWSTTPATPSYYSLTAHVHSHPMNGNQNTPSPLDETFANSYPGLPKYILNMRNVVNYDQNGEIGRERLKDQCPNP